MDNRLHRAIQSVLDMEMSVGEAAKHYNVPRTTISGRLRWEDPFLVKKTGSPAILTQEEESILVQWINKRYQMGYALNYVVLKTILHEIHSLYGIRKIELKKEFPSRNWFQKFFRRHPELQDKRADDFSKGGTVSEETIRSWFDVLRGHLASEGLDCVSFLSEPNAASIYCLHVARAEIKDGILQSTFTDCSEFVRSKDKMGPTITVLCAAGADGTVLNPFFIFPQEEPDINSIHNVDLASFQMLANASGWINEDIFLKWMHSFLEQIEASCVPKPVLLLVEGMSFHISIEACVLGSEASVIIHMLPPGGGMVVRPLQPLMSEIKRRYADAHKIFCSDTKPYYLKNYFLTVFMHSWTTHKNKLKSVKTGFAKAGLVPLDPEQINYEKLPIIKPTRIYNPRPEACLDTTCQHYVRGFNDAIRHISDNFVRRDLRHIYKQSIASGATDIKDNIYLIWKSLTEFLNNKIRKEERNQENYDQKILVIHEQVIGNQPVTENASPFEYEQSEHVGDNIDGPYELAIDENNIKSEDIIVEAASQPFTIQEEVAFQDAEDIEEYNSMPMDNCSVVINNDDDELRNHVHEEFITEESQEVGSVNLTMPGYSKPNGDFLQHENVEFPNLQQMSGNNDASENFEDDFRSEERLIEGYAIPVISSRPRMNEFNKPSSGVSKITMISPDMSNANALDHSESVADNTHGNCSSETGDSKLTKVQRFPYRRRKKHFDGEQDEDDEDDNEGSEHEHLRKNAPSESGKLEKEKRAMPKIKICSPLRMRSPSRRETKGVNPSSNCKENNSDKKSHSTTFSTPVKRKQHHASKNYEPSSSKKSKSESEGYFGCEICFRKSGKASSWIGCDYCERWYHKSCVDIREDLNDRALKRMKWRCSYCLDN